MCDKIDNFNDTLSNMKWHESSNVVPSLVFLSKREQFLLSSPDLLPL